MEKDIVEDLREKFPDWWKDESPQEVIKVYEQEREEALKEIEKLRAEVKRFNDMLDNETSFYI